MTPLPWSFSSLSNFENCPHQFAEVRVYKRFKDEQGEAAIWGEWAHKQIELRYTKQQPWHDNMLPYVPHIEQALEWTGGVRAHAPKDGHTHGALSFAEFKVALTKELRPTEFFAEDVWLRGVLDAIQTDGYEAWVIDWKMGKVKPNSKQLKLFALLVFYKFPWITRCHTSFEWLQHAQSTRETYEITDVQLLWQEFLPGLRDYRQAFKQEQWQKRPSGLCNGWCPVTNCMHWRARR